MRRLTPGLGSDRALRVVRSSSTSGSTGSAEAGRGAGSHLGARDLLGPAHQGPGSFSCAVLPLPARTPGKTGADTGASKDRSATPYAAPGPRTRRPVCAARTVATGAHAHTPAWGPELLGPPLPATHPQEASAGVSPDRGGIQPLRSRHAACSDGHEGRRANTACG